MKYYVFFLMVFVISPTFAAIADNTAQNHYQSNLELRQNKRVGVGASLTGLSSYNIHLELNIEDQDGVVAGFGYGNAYNSFQLLWKHSFEGEYFTPYSTAGVSTWYNSTGGGNVKRNYILNSALRSQQKESGRFNVTFATIAIGAQYNQLSGELVGASFFGELQAMQSLENASLLPAGAFGAIYYF